MTPTWPKQSECPTFYGDPRDKNFERDNLVIVPFPWMTVTAWDGKRVKGARVHKKCSRSLERVFAIIWSASGESQDTINEWGMNKYGGGYCFRQMRGSKRLSMHSYGCAVDFDPVDNAQGDTTPEFDLHPIVKAAFKAEGWTWGGDWRSHNGRWIDGMHWQAARV